MGGSTRERLGPVLPATIAVVVLFGGALVGAIRTSLQPGPGGALGAVDGSAWRAVLSDPVFADALVFTARITLISTLASAGLAILAATVLRGLGPVPRGLFGFPILVPHLVAAVVAVLWLGPGGLADRLLGGLPFDVIRDRGGWGVVLVYVYKEVPFLTLLVLAAWNERVAERQEAAAVAGAGPLGRFRWVVWPAVRAPLAIGCLIVAAFVFGSFEVPLVVGPSYPPTVAVYALDETRTALLEGQARSAVALLVATVVSLGFAVVVARAVRGSDVL